MLAVSRQGSDTDGGIIWIVETESEDVTKFFSLLTCDVSNSAPNGPV